MSLNPLDWESQRAFLAVLREGSLSAAARALGIAQPTVRRRLDALERSIGVALFTRSPSGLTPTDAARELGTHAETMAAAADAFARAASADTDAASGTVRITASDVMGAEVLPAVLAELQDAQPGLVFELSLTNRNEDLLRHEADIAVRMVRPTQAAMVATRVGVVELGFYARAAYLEKHGTPTALDELGRFALIGPDRETAYLSTLRALGVDLKRSMLSCRTDSQVAQLGAIRAGLGIGICQKGLALRDPLLVPVLANEFRYELETWVTMHEDLRRMRRVRATFAHLVAALTSYCNAGSAPA
ncbi:LysR family transcriptional regulator [Variovorax sp. J22R24]|uniref:LysR family transcriptional regulator n=1 Tax=Variovorax gracilis TaxID=3053502 RepID=UPI0025770CE2|nr:LysR family transcriptional regulator [Variovorax sp. J22R24]MDM0106894.1 LysR family transcriptional regulator [Variovorax sp. J22R24]